MSVNIITERVIGSSLEPGLTLRQVAHRIATGTSCEVSQLPEEPAYVKEWFDPTIIPLKQEGAISNDPQ